MQFILEQQARLAVNQAKAEERFAADDERMKRIEKSRESMARQIEHLGGALIELTEAHTRA